jgi:hypothetical protein
MDCITLSATRTATAALLATCSLTISTHATEPSQWHPRSMAASSSAVLRDYQLKDVQPCLIGIGTCRSMYPPPAPCWVSTARCSADAQAQFAGTDTR